ncbi:MAG: DNA polymerase III subunit epsilon [Oceanospirillum sp.]|nr:DNA polymerase III subunit epsilon [Oceanospirillum sp.]
MRHHPAERVIVLDFETTGLSPNQGDRVIEVGAVRIENGQVSERFQRLMNPGRRINGFIESYTGISNRMLQDAAPCEEVMSEFADFIEGYNLVAHNASFDSKFLVSELTRIKRSESALFACSMLISRRIYPEAPNHKLASLVHYKQLPTDGTFHRALADAEMTAHLWLAILDDLRTEYGIYPADFALMQKLGKTAKKSVNQFLQQQSS